MTLSVVVNGGIPYSFVGLAESSNLTNKFSIFKVGLCKTSYVRFQTKPESISLDAYEC